VYWSKVFAATSAAILMGLCLWGQTPTGAIEGTVTDPTGAVVPNANVTITETATARVMPMTTDGAGRFVLRNLLPGLYDVKVEAAGFAVQEIHGLTVDTGAVANANVALEVGRTGEVVEISAQAVQVDTTRQVVDSVITEKEFKDTPLFSRNFLDLASLAPGVFTRDGGAIDPTKTVAYRTVGVDGRSGTATRVQVDGVDVTDETVGTTVANFSQEAISEFQLTRSSLDPSTSLTSSGAVNIIGKSGTNAIHGAWFWDYYNQDMGARLNFDSTEAAPFHRQRTGGSFGGPFVKDKVFWFVNWERHYQTEESINRNPLFPQLNVDQPFPVGLRFFDSRVDWNVKPSIRIFAKFHQDWNLSTGGSAVSPFQNVDWTPVVTVGLDVNKARMTHSYRFGYVKFHNRIQSQELKYQFLRTPNGIPYYLAVGSFGAGPNSLAPQATYQTNYQNSYEGSYFTGKHTFRYGFDIRRVILGGFANFAGPTQVTGTYNADIVAQLQAAGKDIQDPTVYPLEYFSMGPANGFFTLAPAHNLPHGGHFITRPSWFVQDSMKLLRNLTINLGLRWQYDTGYFSSKDVPREPLMEMWGKGFSTYPVVPKDLFSPSFGFAWDPRANGKTVIRGGFYKGYEMNIQNNTMFDEFAMLPNGLGPDLYEIYGVRQPDGTPINIDGNHPTGDYSDLIGLPINQVIGTIGQLQAALSNAYSNYKFDPHKGQSAFVSSGGFYYGSVIPGNQYKIPYALQFNLGVQRELKPGTVISVDYLYNHAVGLPFTRVDYQRRRDATTLNVAAAKAKIDSVLGGLTVDQWIAANPGKTIGSFGLINDSVFGGVVQGIGMTRARFTEGGFTKFRAVQVSLRGTQRSLWKVRDAGYNVSYSLGRNEDTGTVSRVEFIATSDCNRDYNSKACFGPNNLDFTHMLSVAGYLTVPGGFRLNSFWTFRTAAAQNLYIPNFAYGSPNYVYEFDLNGDNFQDRLPGVGAGQFGRAVKSFADLNKIIQQFNQTSAGQLAGHAQALAAAGLFTEAQLKALGAVIPSIPLVPTGNPNPWHNLFTTDLRFDRPVNLGRFREGMTFTPYVDFYNLFNHAPAGIYGGLGATFGSLNYNYATAGPGNGPSDLDISRGRIVPTRKVMIGLRFQF
jgi:hypothetical protein